jgi:hypothetical protein
MAKSQYNFLTPHRAAPGAFNVDLDISFIRTD